MFSTKCLTFTFLRKCEKNISTTYVIHKMPNFYMFLGKCEKELSTKYVYP